MNRRVAIGLALVAALAIASLTARVLTRNGKEREASGECASAGVERPIPAQFPRSFPLPPGTRVTEAAVSPRGAVLVRGYAPLSAPEAVTFFRDEPRRAGWRVAAAREREGAGVSAAVTGHGVSGTWTVDELSGCPAAALLTLRFSRA